VAGNSDYLAESVLNFQTGQAPFPAIGNRFLALFTTAPTSDAGTGGTEVSGGSYARQQVAGAVTAAGAISTGSATITMPNVSGSPWVVPGMNVYDITASQQIGTVLTWTGTTLTLTANAAHNGSGSTDSLQFSAWPAASASSGSEPAVTPANVTNANATITFVAATGNWGTVTSFAIYDASTSGNMMSWDYLGNFKWIPFSCTSASPGVLTCDTTSDAPANSSSIVVTSKFGGTLPTTGGSWAGLLTTAGLSGATFTAGVNTTGIGGGQFRQVTSQSIPSGVTASFSASSLTIQQA
jgi:hypothetical protein